MSNHPANTAITGGCLCGNLRYSASADPQFCLYCYCRDCQQSTGSDRFAGVMFGQTELGLVSVCAGTLDDTSLFKPTMAVFTEDAPKYADIPSALIPPEPENQEVTNQT